MFKNVDTKFDLVKLEHEILDFWKEKKSFEKLREKNKGKPRWSFLDGPITANNPMGVHHAWGRTYKDIFQRYHAMLGQELRYQNGFDCQGLWVEVEVEKELGFKSKTDIEKYGIEKFVNACKERVKKYSKIQTEQSIRLGYWMDWDNSYYTMSDINNYCIWLFLKKCHEKGWIYKGHDVMPWCIDCGAAMSQHEIATEGYKERTHTSLIVTFPLIEKEKEALLVWTTTPWTLSSNVAAAVHPDLKYIKVKQKDWIYYLVEDRKDQLIGEYEILDIVWGKELVGLTYFGLYPEFKAQLNVIHKVIPWEDVSSTEGTGIVHIAPGCGQEDYSLSKIHNLSVIAPLDEFGNYLEGFGFLSGKNVTKVTNEIIEDLKKKNRLYSEFPYTHNYPVCWRHGTDLVFRLVDEWFISMDELRHKIIEVTQKTEWFPPFGKDQELDWLRNMHDWMISKKRFWGLALPIFECHECSNFEVIGGYEELKQRSVEGWEEFEGNSPHRPWIDKVKIKCSKCGAIISRILDVGNPWLDAGIVPYSTMGYMEDKEYWKKWFPAELICECFPGQFRNWFYAILAMSTVMEETNPFKVVFGHALVRDENGEEMHKSKGNAIWFDEAAEKMGVDAMRWLFASQNPFVNLNFGYGPADEVKRKLLTLWNCYSFFVTYANIDNFIPDFVIPEKENLTLMDKWILSKLDSLIEVAHNGYSNYNIASITDATEKFLQDLSNWYIRMNRQRFWAHGMEKNKKTGYQVLHYILHTLIKIIAPIIPFITEDIYQNLVASQDSNQPESVHHNEFPKTMDFYDENLERKFEIFKQIIVLGRAARMEASIKTRQPLKEILIYSNKNSEINYVVNTFKPEILKELNVKKIEIITDLSLIQNYKAKLNFSTAGKRLGKMTQKVHQFLQNTNGKELKEKMYAGIINFDVEGTSVTLTSDDIIFEEIISSNYVVTSENNITVALNKEIDQNLFEEGIARDFIRNVQVLRKESGFEITDRISVGFETSEEIVKSLLNWRKFIQNEILADIFKPEPLENTSNSREFKLAETPIKVYVEVIKK